MGGSESKELVSYFNGHTIEIVPINQSYQNVNSNTGVVPIYCQRLTKRVTYNSATRDLTLASYIPPQAVKKVLWSDGENEKGEIAVSHNNNKIASKKQLSKGSDEEDDDDDEEGDEEAASPLVQEIGFVSSPFQTFKVFPSLISKNQESGSTRASVTFIPICLIEEAMMNKAKNPTASSSSSSSSVQIPEKFALRKISLVLSERDQKKDNVNNNNTSSDQEHQRTFNMVIVDDTQTKKESYIAVEEKSQRLVIISKEKYVDDTMHVDRVATTASCFDTTQEKSTSPNYTIDFLLRIVPYPVLTCPIPSSLTDEIEKLIDHEEAEAIIHRNQHNNNNSSLRKNSIRNNNDVDDENDEDDEESSITSSSEDENEDQLEPNELLNSKKRQQRLLKIEEQTKSKQPSIKNNNNSSLTAIPQQQQQKDAGGTPRSRSNSLKRNSLQQFHNQLTSNANNNNNKNNNNNNKVAPSTHFDTPDFLLMEEYPSHQQLLTIHHSNTNNSNNSQHNSPSLRRRNSFGGSMGSVQLQQKIEAEEEAARKEKEAALMANSIRHNNGSTTNNAAVFANAGSPGVASSSFQICNFAFPDYRLDQEGANTNVGRSRVKIRPHVPLHVATVNSTFREFHVFIQSPPKNIFSKDRKTGAVVQTVTIPAVVSLHTTHHGYSCETFAVSTPDEQAVDRYLHFLTLSKTEQQELAKQTQAAAVAVPHSNPKSHHASPNLPIVLHPVNVGDTSQNFRLEPSEDSPGYFHLVYMGSTLLMQQFGHHDQLQLVLDLEISDDESAKLVGNRIIEHAVDVCGNVKKVSATSKPNSPAPTPREPTSPAPKSIVNNTNNLHQQQQQALLKSSAALHYNTNSTISTGVIVGNLDPVALCLKPKCQERIRSQLWSFEVKNGNVTSACHEK